MNPLILSGLFTAAQSLIERFFPDPEKKAAAQLELLKMQQNGELAQLAASTDLVKGQLEINKEEAKSSSLLVAGWRPMAGWVSVFGLAYVSVVEPMARFVSQVWFDYKGPFPMIDTTLTMQVLIGMLGLVAARSVDKKNGVNS
jgi:4-hydroxy-L-threonine phosphate dehydrogenase PdxA